MYSLSSSPGLMPADSGSASTSSGGMPADDDAGSKGFPFGSLGLVVGVKGAKAGVSGAGTGVFGETFPEEYGGIFSARTRLLNLARQMLECLLVGASNLQARHPSVGPNRMMRSKVMYSLRLAVVSTETLEKVHLRE